MAVRVSDNQALYCEGAVAESMPFAVGVWFRAKTTSNNHPLFWMGDKYDSNIWCDLEARGGQAGDPVRLVQKWGPANYRDAESEAYSAQTWHHLVGVWASTTSRSIWLDGVDSANSSESVELAGYNRTALGALLDASPTYEDWQELAEAAVWHRVPAAWEIQAMAARWSPLFFLDGLEHYYPLGGRFGQNYRDIVGGYDLADWSTAVEWVADPPGIIYPDDPQLGQYRVQIGPYEVAAGEVFHTGAEAGQVNA